MKVQGRTNYEDEDDFKFILNYGLRSKLNLPCLQLYILIIYFSERVPTDYPEIYESKEALDELRDYPIISNLVYDFFTLSYIAENLEIVKRGQRDDGLDCYVEPKSAAKLILESGIISEYFSYIDFEVFKGLFENNSTSKDAPNRDKTFKKKPYKAFIKSTGKTVEKQTKYLIKIINDLMNKDEENNFPDNEIIIERLNIAWKEESWLKGFSKVRGLDYEFQTQSGNVAIKTYKISSIKRAIKRLRKAHASSN